MPTQERLREVLYYDQETGVFTWKVNIGQRARVGAVAGSLNSGGYLVIGVGGRQYKAHRLAWLYVHGVWPEAEIDHMDRNQTNNALSNLRPATHKQNCENRGMRNDNSSGYTGVYWHEKTQKWQAGIGHRGEFLYLGLFNTPEEASAAYESARNNMFTHQEQAA